MDSRNMAIGTVISLQSALGILGNIFSLFYYLLAYYNKHTLKTVDLILTHVFTSNSLIILSTGVPHIMRAFEWKMFFNDVECKLILYVKRLGRSMSITTTCLMSVSQTITISTSDSCWKGLKIKLPIHIHFSISLLWVLYIIVNMIFPMYSSMTKRNSKNETKKRYFEFCSFYTRDKTVDLLYIAFWVFPEVLFSIFIVCSSISMIVMLYRHKKRVQYILSTQVSTRISPESRATQNILVLACTFLLFYSFSSILHTYIALSHNSNLWLMDITAIISMFFPTLCPFLRSNFSTASRFYFSWIRNIKMK